MDEYRVRLGRQEYMTKCAYDAAAALEFILAHAEELRLDPHRMSLEATSAGGGPASYLLWVYRRWHAARYTPRAFVYSSGQLLYPVQNALADTWAMFGDALGDGYRQLGRTRARLFPQRAPS